MITCPHCKNHIAISHREGLPERVRRVGMEYMRRIKEGDCVKTIVADLSSRYGVSGRTVFNWLRAFKKCFTY